MDQTPRSHIPAKVRQYVFDRDHNQCQKCGCTCTEFELTIGHIIPLAAGGSNQINNLRTLCRTCNETTQSWLEPRLHRHDRSDVSDLVINSNPLFH